MKVDRCVTLWRILFLLTWICAANGIYLQNSTKRPDRRHDSVTSWTDAVDEQDGLWSTLLTDWTVSDDQEDSHRIGKVLQVTRRYIPASGFFVTRRTGEDIELEPHRRHPGKILDFNAPVKEGTAQREVSETDLYLLGAIEKLVYRVDYMEKRLRRTEQLLYYMMQGNNQREDPCPENFTRAGGNCYHFGINREINWKAASSFCKSMGAHLAEFETVGEYKDVAQFLLNHQTFKEKNFWVGGLNPGLLWIWSHSAKPINPDTNLADVVNSTSSVQSIKKGPKPAQKPAPTASQEKLLNIKGSGRCLSLTFAPNSHNYTYFGQDCSSRQNYLCEHIDRSLENEISRISRQIFLN
ncbi:uncharacterized protein LOC132260416 isoform X2 [Phlebotomus argentipes]|uniref:uncharacterized protein LOC132260416 isoform X2 n=1 Tax=Phlebotomus argentipes TaxID=94469 RepID=UPI0028935CD2|nr:uncharacterized protein LOC132260416 isoform X2 [Phlebotomus argentipes]